MVYEVNGNPQPDSHDRRMYSNILNIWKSLFYGNNTFIACLTSILKLNFLLLLGKYNIKKIAYL